MVLLNLCISSVFAVIEEMSDYEGGKSPLLIIFIICMILALMISSLVYFLINMHKKATFNKICNDASLTNEELGALRTFFSRLNIANQLPVVSNKVHYDLFLIKVGHWYASAPLSLDEVNAGMDLFKSIRVKLRFTHSFRIRNIHSTHILPRNIPLHVDYFDKETRNTLSFETVMKDATEFFIAIKPPQGEIYEDIDPKMKPLFNVTFIREGDSEYLFETRFFRKVKTPRQRWHLLHSNSITKGNTRKPVDLAGHLMITVDERSKDYDANIILIDKTHCTFQLKNTNDQVEEGGTGLLNFNMGESAMSTQISIIKKTKQKTRTVYQANFKKLNKDSELSILKFMEEHKKKIAERK